MNYILQQGERRGLTRPPLLASQKVQFNELNWPAATARFTEAAARAFRVTTSWWTTV
jgi:hypothetical protein